MTRERAIKTLRAHEDLLRHRGVTHLRVFGSVAREEATDASDVDLLADFDPSRQISLLDMIDIQVDLESALGASVDLVEERSLKPRARERAVREAVVAF